MKIKLEELKNMMFVNEIKEPSFIGYTTKKHVDVFGTAYETLELETKYLYFAEVFGSRLYVTEAYLLDILLTDYLKPVIDRSIYDHGYPESRLIPSNFYEDCQKDYLDSVISDFTDKISDIISGEF